MEKGGIYIKTEEKEFYTCKYDRAFKEVFLNEKNKYLLKVLLENILKVKISSIEILNNERNVDNIHVARKHVDALIDTDQGLIGIEVNTSKEDYVRPRNFSFIADAYSHYTLRGEKYSENFNIVQINFSYNLSYKDLYRIFKVRDDNGNLYAKNLIIYEFNMDKYTRFWYTKDTKKIEEFKYLIMLNLKDEDLKILSKGDKVVSTYMDELTRVNKNPKFREYISAEEDNRKIMNSLRSEYMEKGLKDGIEEGKKIGIKEGVKEGVKQTALSMLEENIDIEVIEKCTKLSVKEIKELAHNIYN